MNEAVSAGAEIVSLRTTEIRTDGGTQSRAIIDRSVVVDYAEAYRGGAKFPPIVVFHDGEHYWLADGFLRLEARKRCALGRIDADVRSGSRRDAILHSVGANARHGLRRSNADKRRCVAILLGDAEWGARSDSWIAKAAGVSRPFVDKIRRRAKGAGPTVRRGMDGKTYPARISSSTDATGRRQPDVAKTTGQATPIQPVPKPWLPTEPNAAARDLLAWRGAEWCRDLVVALDAACERGDA